MHDKILWQSFSVKKMRTIADKLSKPETNYKNLSVVMVKIIKTYV